MQFQELIILLPCHSLEDFPQHHEGAEADGLLANWTAMWHPALIAAANSAPTWQRVDDPPLELEGRLLLVPSVSVDQLATGFVQRAKSEGACLIRKLSDRQEILARIFESFDADAAAIDPELVADFLALGYCYLQVQLLTRQMRYASNLDEVHFNEQLLAGAQAAASGDLDRARDKVSACFDLLAEERDHYYSVDCFLIDLALTAPTTAAASIRDELESDSPVNFLMAADFIAQLAEQDRATSDSLAAAIAAEQAGLIGGEESALRLPLLSAESVLRELRRGTSHTEATLGQRVRVHGRRRYGLTPFQPQVLEKLGFDGSLHATMDDGRFPTGTQIKTRWEGKDGAAIDAIAKAPLDANDAETFLSLATKLGESMDMDHVATLMFAHWPGHTSTWYDDLRRCAKFGSALGKFVTIDAYFRDTYMPGHQDRFEADQYRSPYLKQSIIRRDVDPLSTIQRYWQRHVTATAVRSLTFLASLVQGSELDGLSEDLLNSVDLSSDQPDAEGLDERLAKQLEQAQTAFADSLPRTDSPPQDAYLVMNPHSVVRRVGVDLPGLASLPKIEKPIYAASESADSKHVVVDVPAMGFVWVTPDTSKKKAKPSPALAEDRRNQDGPVVLRNEFLEAAINPTTGALSSVKDYSKRGNRLSQQLGLRLPGPRGQTGDTWRSPDDNATYSVMAADAIEVVHASSAFGEVSVTGRLLDREGKLQANYRETFRLWRGTRVLHLQVTIEPELEPAADPWNSYYACRFAWADEVSELFRDVNQTRHRADRKKIDAPLYIDIDNGEIKTTILTGGLPYHQRVGDRMLDTMLALRNERQQTFHLGIGIDVPHSHHEATSLLTPQTAIYQSAPAPQSGTSSWLFHIDARSIAATHWAPLNSDGTITGFRVRLLETSGNAARARLSTFRPIASARQMDFTSQSRGECQLNEGRVQLEFAAGEWMEVEVIWE